jgi:hypothetical protein
MLALLIFIIAILLLCFSNGWSIKRRALTYGVASFLSYVALMIYGDGGQSKSLSDAIINTLLVGSLISTFIYFLTLSNMRKSIIDRSQASREIRIDARTASVTNLPRAEDEVSWERSTSDQRYPRPFNQLASSESPNAQPPGMKRRVLLLFGTAWLVSILGSTAFVWWLGAFSSPLAEWYAAGIVIAAVVTLIFLLAAMSTSLPSPSAHRNKDRQ